MVGHVGICHNFSLLPPFTPFVVHIIGVCIAPMGKNVDNFKILMGNFVIFHVKKIIRNYVTLVGYVNVFQGKMHCVSIMHNSNTHGSKNLNFFGENGDEDVDHK